MKEKKTLKERWIKTKEDSKEFWDEHGSWICMTLAAATLTGFAGYLMGEDHEKNSIIGGLTNAQMKRITCLRPRLLKRPLGIIRCSS